MERVVGLVLALSAVLAAQTPDVLLMNRIGPSSSELFVANADGTGDRQLIAQRGR